MVWKPGKVDLPGYPKYTHPKEWAALKAAQHISLIFSKLYPFCAIRKTVVTNMQRSFAGLSAALPCTYVYNTALSFSKHIKCIAMKKNIYLISAGSLLLAFSMNAFANIKFINELKTSRVSIEGRVTLYAAGGKAGGTEFYLFPGQSAQIDTVNYIYPESKYTGFSHWINDSGLDTDTYLLPTSCIGDFKDNSVIRLKGTLINGSNKDAWNIRCEVSDFVAQRTDK